MVAIHFLFQTNTHIKLPTVSKIFSNELNRDTLNIRQPYQNVNNETFDWKQREDGGHLFFFSKQSLSHFTPND